MIPTVKLKNLRSEIALEIRKGTKDTQKDNAYFIQRKKKERKEKQS